jgi:hypothetical protein
MRGVIVEETVTTDFIQKNVWVMSRWAAINMLFLLKLYIL